MPKSKQGNENVIRNLRFAFKDKIAYLTDEELLQEYEDFGFSDMSGDNDARFLEWLGIEEAK